jgi:hypothetical protein
MTHKKRIIFGTNVLQWRKAREHLLDANFTRKAFWLLSIDGREKVMFVPEDYT